MASRSSSGEVLNALAKNVPWLIGGAADLAPSTKTRLTFKEAGDFEAGSYGGRNLHFGIREHAMGAILNGMATVKVRPYGSGFLIFSDYGRAPIRLASIMELPVIYVFTHDSIGRCSSFRRSGRIGFYLKTSSAVSAMASLSTLAPTTGKNSATPCSSSAS